MSRNLEEARRWLSQAHYDLQAARINQKHGVYAWACFLCQQAAEKALKAFLYAQGEGPVIGHSSFRLAQACATFDSEFNQILRACKTLDGYYIPTRYPNGLPDGVPHEVYDAVDAGEALEAGAAVLSLVESQDLFASIADTPLIDDVDGGNNDFDEEDEAGN